MHGLSNFQKPPHRFFIFLLTSGLLIITLGALLVSGDLRSFLLMRTASAVESTSKTSPAKKHRPANHVFKISKDEIPVLHSLKERQEMLDKREETVAQKEEELSELETLLDKRLENLAMLRREIGELIREREAFEERRFEHLVKVYEGMKPAEAARLIERLNNETAVKLFYRMKEQKVSRILGFIKPEVAARLSESLATYLNANGQASGTGKRK